MERKISRKINGLGGKKGQAVVSRVIKKKNHNELWIHIHKTPQESAIVTQNENVCMSETRHTIFLETTVPRYSSKLFNRAFQWLKKQPQFQRSFWNMFPKHQEICETVAVIPALEKSYPRSIRSQVFADSTMTCFVIGDGKHPKVALWLRCRYIKWKIITIDPLLERRWSKKNKLNVVGASMRDDEYTLLDAPEQNFIVIAVHSHGNLQTFCQRLSQHGTLHRVVTIPCCENVCVQRLEKKPLLDYEDNGIPSHCNRVLVYD